MAPHRTSRSAHLRASVNAGMIAEVIAGDLTRSNALRYSARRRGSSCSMDRKINGISGSRPCLKLVIAVVAAARLSADGSSKAATSVAEERLPPPLEPTRSRARRAAERTPASRSPSNPARAASANPGSSGGLPANRFALARVARARADEIRTAGSPSRSESLRAFAAARAAIGSETNGARITDTVGFQ